MTNVKFLTILPVTNVKIPVLRPFQKSLSPYCEPLVFLDEKTFPRTFPPNLGNLRVDVDLNFF